MTKEKMHALKASGKSHEGGDLTGGNGDGGSRHESRHGGGGNELYEPTDAQESDSKDDESGDKGEGGGNDGTRVNCSTWL